jgi:hypothetical protein
VPKDAACGSAGRLSCPLISAASLTLRLGARIWDLRNKGYRIRTEELPDKNTVYHLEAVPKAQQLELIN